jgi:hypothetical protein
MLNQVLETLKNQYCKTLAALAIMCGIINIIEDSNLALEFFILKILAYKE